MWFKKKGQAVVENTTYPAIKYKITITIGRGISAFNDGVQLEVCGETLQDVEVLAAGMVNKLNGVWDDTDKN